MDNSTTKFPPRILFQDYQGYWSPLSSLYWSQQSKLLVSRHPKSCIEEIISHYCPQCLTRYSDDEVASFMNHCPSCYQCPCCEGFLTNLETATGEEHLFFCGMCFWRSDHSNLAEIDKAHLEETIIKKEKDTTMKEAFGTLLAQLQQTEADFTKSIRSELFYLKNARSRKNNKEEGVFKEVNREDIEQLYVKPSAPQVAPVALSPGAVERFESQQQAMLADHDFELTDLTQRILNINKQPTTTVDMMPLRLKLRTKKTVRCRADAEAGKMSILVQPKVFPLDGDSSMRLQKGKWWVKDSSAVHELPFVSITKVPSRKLLSRGEYSAIEISITNPREAYVAVSFSSVDNENNELPSTYDSATECLPELYPWVQQQQQQQFPVVNRLSYSPLLSTKASSASLVDAATAAAVTDTSGCDGTGTMPPQLPSHKENELCVIIEPYEDELLRDEVPNSKQTRAIVADSEGSDPAWSVRHEHNTAFFSIPLKLADRSFLADGESVTGSEDEIEFVGEGVTGTGKGREENPEAVNADDAAAGEASVPTKKQKKQRSLEMFEVYLKAKVHLESTADLAGPAMDLPFRIIFQL